MTHVFNNKTNVTAANLKTVIVEGETVNTVTPADTEDLENYSPSLGTNITLPLTYFERLRNVSWNY